MVRNVERHRRRVAAEVSRVSQHVVLETGVTDPAAWRAALTEAFGEGVVREVTGVTDYKGAHSDADLEVPRHTTPALRFSGLGVHTPTGAVVVDDLDDANIAAAVSERTGVRAKSTAKALAALAVAHKATANLKRRGFRRVERQVEDGCLRIEAFR